jgi:uncharacterized protein YyaL (SSP411 family)
MITAQNTNRLINASSPYLLQHAYNPVDWYEWGEEALQRARSEDKPILVSIGYSACHWCHVMERECFEKESVAAVMNANFICIKVDREERPDIDQVYMDAVHALGVQGGWPLNVFLTPEQKPFFGGTYFSPDLWIQVLNNLHNAFQTHRDKVENSAEELRKHLQRSDVAAYIRPREATSLDAELKSIYGKLEAKFDKSWGGLDRAPKFIMPSVWLWILRYFHLTQDESALAHVVLTLKKIARGGIYDQIGGGFARYSVDGQWFVPHFEKMLYDNAQLMSLYSEAYAITKDEEFKNVVYETFDWLQRELTSDDGGFFSALDADSEGEEGKFYVWTKEELERVLEDDAIWATTYFGIDAHGNWEHGKNILIRPGGDDVFISENKFNPRQWPEIIKATKKSLLRERSLRIAPGLDDKILTSWNAMMISGLTDAYKAFDDQRFYKAALHNMRFLENEVMESTTIYRSYKNKRASIPGFLDDYAFVIQAQVKLYEITFDEYWIRRAGVFLQHVIENFLDKTDGYFHYTSNTGEKLIARKKEVLDNVIPSSNAIMAWNLFRLGTITSNEDWKKMAVDMTSSLSYLINEEPNYMSQWAIVYTEIRKGLAEIVFTGDDIEVLRQEFHIAYEPFCQALGARTKSNLPLLQDKKPVNGKATVYVCYQQTCQAPVHTIDAATALLDKIM